MKTSSWIVCGLGLNIAAAALHGASGPQAMLTSGLASTLPKLMLVMAGNICIWQGLRSAMRDVWGGLTGKKYRNAPQGKAPQSARFDADAAPSSDFDADEAFARYMAQRKACEAEPEPMMPAAAPHRTGARPHAPVQGGFGRRVV